MLQKSERDSQRIRSASCDLRPEKKPMRSLRTRLTLTHTLVALLAVLLVGILSTVLINNFFRRYARDQTQEQTQEVAARLEQLYDAQGRGQTLAVLLQMRRSVLGSDSPLPAARQFIIADTQGVVLFDPQTRLEGKVITSVLRERAEPIISANGTQIGFVTTRADRSPISAVLERNFLLRVYLSVACSSVLASTLALVIGLLLSKRLTTPVRSLTAAAHSLATRQRHGPIPIIANDEIGELTHAFNSMAGELERQEDLRRQQVADIAHELRTPLSVLRLQVESLQDGVEQPTPDTLASLGEEVGLLSRLVDDLRLLSLADAGQLQLHIEELDAQVALERAAAVAAPRAREQGVEIQVMHGHDLPPLYADPQRLAQVLGNLVENALRYTPRGGRVTLRAYVEGRRQKAEGRRQKKEGKDWGDAASVVLNQAASSTSHVLVLEVADTGLGIPPDDLAHIFDRFYRTDRARARETGGSGLGLAIVQRLVEAQGGQVCAMSLVGKGSTFSVELPVSGGDKVRG